ncbi:Kazal-type serine protease inhibitor family protein [Sorangium cellulosum]|uniref:Kazal-type serine protease inhibitor family protein n=1 Tax=Sorangium cellulosum TaxID=56 RepID=UPI003D9A955D
MRRFDGLGVLLALAASGCAVSTEMDGAAAGTAEGEIAPEAVSAAPAALGQAPQGAAPRGAAWIDEGEPPTDTPAPIAEVGESCGGFTRGPAPVCAEGLYCDYTLEDVCGWADASGLCAERPASCTEEYMPVCGCDNRTYANACLAAMDGVAVYTKGECTGTPKSE